MWINKEAYICITYYSGMNTTSLWLHTYLAWELMGSKKPFPCLGALNVSIILICNISQPHLPVNEVQTIVKSDLPTLIATNDSQMIEIAILLSPQALYHQSFWLVHWSVVRLSPVYLHSAISLSLVYHQIVTPLSHLNVDLICHKCMLHWTAQLCTYIDMSLK